MHANAAAAAAAAHDDVKVYTYARVYRQSVYRYTLIMLSLMMIKIYNCKCSLAYDANVIIIFI